MTQDSGSETQSLPRQETVQRDGEKKPGVVYLSRIPPRMSPSKLRHILNSYGCIGRIYLQPKQTVKRKESIKHAPHLYEEGWVEFEEKRVAKSVASLLNGRTIGGKKSSRFHDDIWGIKYLPGFKWTMLTEQMAQERAEAADKLRLRIEAGKLEQTQYLEQVEKARIQQLAYDKKNKRKHSLNEDNPPPSKNCKVNCSSDVTPLLDLL